MKVLCVIPCYWPAFKYGGPIMVHKLNKYLVKKGLDVTVYTTNEGIEDKVETNKEINMDGVKVTYFPYTKAFDHITTKGWAFSYQMTIALKKTVANYDIVNIESLFNYQLIAAAHYCKKYKKPYLLTFRGSLYPYFFRKNNWKRAIYYNLIIRKYIGYADCIRYTSNDEFINCHQFLKIKNDSVVIPNAIDLSEFKDLPDKTEFRDKYTALKNKKILLFLGRLHWKKGLDILSKAFSILLKKHSDLHLLIVGPDENNYQKQLEDWFKSEGINEHVTFTGILKGRDKYEAYRCSDIFVLSSYSENFGYSVVESMACGVPVVISDQVGIYKEIEDGKAGIIVKTSVESLVNGITTVLDNDTLKSRIIKNAYKNLEDYFSIDKVADKVVELYNNMITGSHK